MKIKPVRWAALLVVFAQTAALAQAGAPTQNAAGMQLQGDLKLQGAGFKGNIQFDGNPLNMLMQQQAPAAVPAAQPPAQTLQSAPLSYSSGAASAEAGFGSSPAPEPIQPPPSQSFTAPATAMQPQGSSASPATATQPPASFASPPAPAAPLAAPAAPLGVPASALGTPALPQLPAFTMPSFNPNDVRRTTEAIGAGMMQTLPRMGVPVDPRVVRQGESMIEQFLGGNKPAQRPVSNAMQPNVPMQQFQVTPDLLNALMKLSQSAQFEMQQAQTGAYLSGIGDPSMRLSAALEAQKNATQARALADRVAPLAPVLTGESAQLLTTIREAADRAQTFADQARTAADASAGLAPQQ